MALLAAYFDDSGTHATSEWVVVSGAVASIQQWERLSRSWRHALSTWNLSKGYFRMADFVNGVGDYREWPPREKELRLGRLIEILQRNVRVLVGNAVKQVDFNEAYRRCPCPLFGTPYRFCAFLALPAVNSWRVKSPRRQPVHFVFESGNKLLNEFGKILAQIGDVDGSREKFGVASITQREKKDAPPLQAADLVAYATYKALMEKDISPDYLRDALARLFEIEHEGYPHAGPDLIERHFRRVNAGWEHHEKT